MDDFLEQAVIDKVKQDVFSRFKPTEIIFHARVEVDRHVSKKNSRPIFKRGSRSFLGKSPKLVSAEDQMVHQLRLQRVHYGIAKPFECDLWALFVFNFKDYYVKDKKRRRGNLPDLSNLLELPADCLQKAEVIKNDTQICSFDLSRRLPSESNYLEVFLMRYHEVIESV